jgi:replicative DNA helicase
MENKEYYNTDCEEVLLGTIIASNSYFKGVRSTLKAEYFYSDDNKKIFKELSDKLIRGKQCNAVTLKDFFTDNTDGGYQYLKFLMTRASAIVDLKEYAQKISELWQKREIQDEILNLKLNKDGDEIISRLINKLNGLRIGYDVQKTSKIEEVIEEIDELDRNFTAKPIPTGFPTLDKMMNGGLNKKQLTILGARPSLGKTTMGQNIILNAQRRGFDSLFISLEIDKRQVLLKFLSMMAKVDGYKIQTKTYDQSDAQKIIEAKKQLKQMNLRVNDTCGLDYMKIDEIVRQAKDTGNLDLVLVDYVQIINSIDARWKNKADLIKEATTHLKQIAIKYDVAVLALCQINRQGVQDGKQPSLTDLKGSGGIEEDADVVIILHRDQAGEDESATYSNEGKLIIAKNRFGMTSNIPINFDGKYAQFIESTKKYDGF